MRIKKVSQPVAAVGSFESGSNENGSWIKYSDGTMICYHNIEGTTFNCTRAGASGAYYYTDTNNSAENSKRWDYPVPFKENTIPVVSVNVASNGYTMSSLGFINNNWVRGYCAMAYPADNVKFTWHFIAIGKWK